MSFNPGAFYWDARFIREMGEDADREDRALGPGPHKRLDEASFLLPMRVRGFLFRQHIPELISMAGPAARVARCACPAFSIRLQLFAAPVARVASTVGVDVA